MSFHTPTRQVTMSDVVKARLNPPVRSLDAGPWSARLVGDELAHLSYAGRPVLRAVKAVVRDQDWRTVPPSLKSVRVLHVDDGLQVHWDVRFEGLGAAYQGRLTAGFTPDAVEVSLEGEAVSAFRSNRIGLVVLHPPSDAGREVTVEHPVGSREAARFPVNISPHQPFMDIAALEWEDGGTPFRLSFTGDVFETEDQRNWTDASFKTYSTPLARPFPVEVAAGDKVRQSVRLAAMTLKMAGLGGPTRGPGDSGGGTTRVDARLGGVRGHVPSLALEAGPQPAPLPALPGLGALLVELVEVPGAFPRKGWPAQLHEAANQAAFHRAALDIRIVAKEPLSAVPVIAPYLATAVRLAAFDPETHVTNPDAWPDFAAAARSAGFNGSLLAGARSHFTELNRNSRRMPLNADALTFSITAQMHSTEAAHIIESIPMQELVARNALRLGSGKPVQVGPISLRPRFNAVATSGNSSAGEADELQHEEFTAAWTLASIDAMTVAGVESLTYFSTSGASGIADAGGRLNPAGEILRQLAGLRNRTVRSVEMTTDTNVTVYPVESPEGLVVFAANLSPSAVDLVIDHTADSGHSAPAQLSVRPYATAVVSLPKSAG